MLRALIVEDSPTMGSRLSEVLSADPAIEVVGIARDGRAGVALCEDLKPGIVTMDIVLPGMDGVAATESIMMRCPTPILVVSSADNRGEAFETCQALAAGAVEALDKPLGDEPAGAWEARFLAAVKLVSRIPVVTRHRARRPAQRVVRPDAAARPVAETRRFELVGLGASTGGPRAVATILASLPKEFSLPILTVVHVNVAFAPAFAEWLGKESGRRVSFARDGDAVESFAGRVALAPPDLHMQVKDGRIRLSDGRERHSCRPSIDALFESLAGGYGPGASAVLLSGMGCDGATGLLAVRRAGGLTIAQDEATSVVYGMPREAARIGAAERILPLGEIAPALAALQHRRAGRAA